MMSKGCRCHRCGKLYRVDLNLPDALWDQIAGGKVMLCGPCIAMLIEAAARAKDQCGSYTLTETL